MIVIRHSEDSSETTYRHDTQLTVRGQELARQKGDRLIQKYGLPKVVYCSPFRRTKETLKLMFSAYQTFPMKVEYTTGLSRYFSARERKAPDVAGETLRAKIPLQENNSQFHKRVRKFAWSVLQSLENKKDVVWLITHSTVYKHIARIFDVEIPEFIKPVGNFTVIAKNNYQGWCNKCGVFHRKP